MPLILNAIIIIIILLNTQISLSTTLSSFYADLALLSATNELVTLNLKHTPEQSSLKTKMASISAMTSQPKRRRNVSQFSAASRKTALDDAVSLAPSSVAGSDCEEDDAYRQKRSRNNAAVRRSRQRSKGQAENAERHLIELRKENQNLAQREKQLKEELELLKEAFMQQMTDHLQRSRAYDAVVNAGNDDDDNNNNDNNNNHDNDDGATTMFLNGDQLCLATVVPAAVQKGFPGSVTTVIPASTSGAIQKDDAGGHVTSIGVTGVTGVTGRGVTVDLKKEKKFWRNNSNQSTKDAFM